MIFGGANSVLTAAWAVLGLFQGLCSSPRLLEKQENPTPRKILEDAHVSLSQMFASTVTSKKVLNDVMSQSVLTTVVTSKNVLNDSSFCRTMAAAETLSSDTE